MLVNKPGSDGLVMQLFKGMTTDCNVSTSDKIDANLPGIVVVTLSLYVPVQPEIVIFLVN